MAVTIAQTIRGVISMGTTDTTLTATIPAVVLARTELSWQGTTGGQATPNPGPSAVRVELTNATTITATRNTTGGGTTAAVGYQVTERAAA